MYAYNNSSICMKNHRKIKNHLGFRGFSCNSYEPSSRAHHKPPKPKMVLFPMIHAQTSLKGIFFDSKTMLWQQPDARKGLLGFEGPCPNDTPFGSQANQGWTITHMWWGALNPTLLVPILRSMRPRGPNLTQGRKTNSHMVGGS
jgi:hypothetical protein